MKKIKKINNLVVLVLVAASLMFTASCKKENSIEPTSSKDPISLSDVNKNIFNQFGFSPWHMRSSGASAGQGIIDMSEPDQFTCYGIIFDGAFNPTNDITITHNGGATWHSQTIAGLNNNWIFGVAATTPGTLMYLVIILITVAAMFSAAPMAGQPGSAKRLIPTPIRQVFLML